MRCNDNRSAEVQLGMQQQRIHEAKTTLYTSLRNTMMPEESERETTENTRNTVESARKFSEAAESFLP